MSNEVAVDPRFEELLDYIKTSRTADFTGYKRSSLMRRVTKRMHDVNIDDFNNYIEYLEIHPDEYIELLNTILINVTSFFRDPLAWQYLAEEIIPKILKNKISNEPIRVWSAGCASGEEPYSLAMLFAERLGLENLNNHVKIYATDIDDGALAQSRLASYRARDVEPVSEELRKKYFTCQGSTCTLKPELRRSVIFGRNDLVQDAPISRLDLLVCRNVLMYMNADTQRHVLARFHFALKPAGYLFVGKAELMLTQSDLFCQANLKHRIFKKSDKVSNRDRFMTLAQLGTATNLNVSRIYQLREMTFEEALSAQLIVDVDGNLLLANQRARDSFAIGSKNLGRPFQDLELSYKPAELRSVLEQCFTGREPQQLEGIECRDQKGNVSYLDIFIVPLTTNGTLLGACIRFVDVTVAQKLKLDLMKANQDLETTNEELHSAQEELETTNEELQSTNEELETTNEELQSTNEELETMNEELQSTNAELETVNTEYRMLTDDVNVKNLFLNSILGSLDSAVIVLNKGLEIQLWNDRAADLWGLRADEVGGKSIFGLDIGLPVDQLKKPMKEFLASGGDRSEILNIEARNRRGKEFKCTVKMTMLSDKKDGLVLLIDEAR